ncbi:MAG: glutathione S-transferase family protein [Gammaproteobacteria bacterium]|nr:glutathione S-transferase family protein [Gammaproteobacteria bacterium]NNF50489.1 glutathione S-transferase [Woeseiaceae bacterium]MBT8093286.1 glutathione S-transferase family protein [Gammaproteobacteria bacterium]MBT8106092.1 glutathione S-transferase family protein [Gammaproteobacteria bacterium]NNK26106.1 glutathione S-transferase [Woeseiaceae bacterium]
MTSYRLTYFDMDGGRAEPIRIAFHAAGIEFEDVRISFPEFAEMREGFRFRCAPILEIDGAPFTQSNAMARYIGKMAGLYPEDDVQALYCDEAMGAIEDLLHQVVLSMGLEGEELKAARETLVDGWLTTFLKGLDEMLERGGDYFADDRLTVADLKVAGITAWIESGGLDHIPTDLVKRLSPRLSAHKDLVFADPVVASYYAARAAA